MFNLIQLYSPGVVEVLVGCKKIIGNYLVCTIRGLYGQRISFKSALDPFSQVFASCCSADSLNQYIGALLRQAAEGVCTDLIFGNQKLSLTESAQSWVYSSQFN